MLQADDVPIGFSDASSSSSSSSSSDPAKANLDSCLKRVTGSTSEDFDKDRTAKAQRRFRSRGGDLEGKVEFYKTTSSAQQQIDVTKRDDAIQCLADSLTQVSSDPRFTIDAATVAARPPTPAVGEQQTSIAVDLELASGGTKVAVNISEYIVKKGRVIVSLTVTTAGANKESIVQPDASVISTALEAMVKRLP